MRKQGKRVVLYAGAMGPPNAMEVVVDAAGNVFVEDTYINVVRKISPDGKITTVAGNGESVSERAVDVQVNRLRRKIERNPANPLFVQTVRGIGYRLVITT